MIDMPGYFRMARMESKKSDLKIQMGAAISRGGNLIAVGCNQNKSHPMVDTFHLHAEAAAIISRRYNSDSLVNAVIWVYRERANGMPAMAKPCKSCMRLIVAAGIKKVLYTISKPPYYKEINLRGGNSD